MQFKRVNRTERMVRYILADNEKAKDSDVELLLDYMNLCGITLTLEQRRLFRAMPSFESITRCRRKLQEKGEFLSSEQIAKERQERANQYREEMLEW